MHEFKKYEPVENQKYMGIATVMIDKKYIVRFKISQAKDGHGFYVQAASFNMSNDPASMKFVPAFSCDSNYEDSELKNLIIAGVENHLRKPAPSQHVYAQLPQIERGYADAKPLVNHNSRPEPEDQNLPF